MPGAVAAGHPLTAEAACIVLADGGNAFDAALAALAAACVVEPVLTSLGGGGFMLAHRANGHRELFDFFVQTPRRLRPPEDTEFYPIHADFGATRQEFHIGMGAIATPGTIHGLVSVHAALGSMPLPEILAPAIAYARDGIEVNTLQAHIFNVVRPIYLARAEARRIYGNGGEFTGLPGAGDLLRQSNLADTLAQIASEGSAPFYRGEWAQQLITACRAQGGHLEHDDLANYRTTRRRPLSYRYRNFELATNPPPSAGGLLIGFALQLLADYDLTQYGFGSPDHMRLLAHVMAQTNLARDQHGITPELLDPELQAVFRQALGLQPVVQRGTTQISVVDSTGNAASMTLSNGEGCGFVLSGSGIMLNNMLGEEDLNPDGFHRWSPDTRVASMMAPTIASDRNHLIVTGSGGSNRLRTAILQTLIHLIDFSMTAADAVTAPRIHYERDELHIEPGLPDDVLTALRSDYPQLVVWQARNLYFGGAHSVVWDGHRFDGAGDPRRGGVFRIAP